MNQRGALDTKTSVQVMEILKKISKDKLIIMVTHNPDLAEQYSSRIIKILDGVITEDSNPIEDNEITEKPQNANIGRTSMKFWTAFKLSLNNLLTKKGRTVLVAFAGSIGIIGIALVQSVSNGFQAYVDKIQEDTLTSYPLSILQETTDIAGVLLAMTSGDGENSNSETVEEEQYISSMLSNLSTNDLKSFNNYLQENYDRIGKDISSIKYSYSVEPMIYSKDDTGVLKKLNPSDIFKSSYSSSFMISFTSTYSQMIEDFDLLNSSYDMLAGRWPEKYNEMVIVLSEPNSISDLLVYSLGLRDIDELSNIVSKIMNGEKPKINNEPLKLSYEDLMNVKLKLLMSADLYKYNEKYDIYEDMTKDEEYMKSLYDNAIDLEIVGVVTAKEGITTMALNSGVAYLGSLIDYIINYSSNTDIVKKQLENREIDVLSGSRFDEPKSSFGLDFADLISIDTARLQNAFNIKIDQNKLQEQTEVYMTEIATSVTTDTKPAKEDFMGNFETMANALLKSINEGISTEDIDGNVEKYLSGTEPTQIIKSLEEKYLLPKDTFKTAYSGLLKGLLQVYINVYDTANSINSQNQENTNSAISENVDNIISALPTEAQDTISNYVKENQNSITSYIAEDMDDIDIMSIIIKTYTNNTTIQETGDTMAKIMTETVMRKNILEKVGELTGNLTSSFASSFNVDQNKISSSFKMNITEDELTRLISAMMTKTEKTANTNLISLGFQDKEEPTYISFYFNSFDGKENFMGFIDSYNDSQKENGEEDKVINYTDTTGILMGSVKTIVNAVTYVLIAFISISLVVSSIMIGIITYISVYERTKEIGILRAIGASKHNISSIFNAETFIIGLLSGLFGIGITYSLIPIINTILHHFTGNIPLNATFYFTNALILVSLSVVLTLTGGLIPARAASKKDPVIALRTE